MRFFDVLPPLFAYDSDVTEINLSDFFPLIISSYLFQHISYLYHFLFNLYWDLLKNIFIFIPYLFKIIHC